MKALSLRPPWAWAVMNAGKRIENRSWKTRHRGGLLIHASSKCTSEDWDSAACLVSRVAGMSLPHKRDLPQGVIVGVATLGDVVTASESPWFTGPYGFELYDVEDFASPVEHPGSLGLFEVRESVVLEQLWHTAGPYGRVR